MTRRWSGRTVLVLSVLLLWQTGAGRDGLILQTGGELMALKWRFSRLLYTWRRENELTQEEAAERCGVSPRHYLDMEAGRVNPKLSTVIHIASESNISLDVLKSEVRGTHAVSLPPE